MQPLRVVGQEQEAIVAVALCWKTCEGHDARIIQVVVGFPARQVVDGKAVGG